MEIPEKFVYLQRKLTREEDGEDRREQLIHQPVSMALCREQKYTNNVK